MTGTMDLKILRHYIINILIKTRIVKCRTITIRIAVTVTITVITDPMVVTVTDLETAIAIIVQPKTWLHIIISMPVERTIDSCKV